MQVKKKELTFVGASVLSLLRNPAPHCFCFSSNEPVLFLYSTYFIFKNWFWLWFYWCYLSCCLCFLYFFINLGFSDPSLFFCFCFFCFCFVLFCFIFGMCCIYWIVCMLSIHCHLLLMKLRSCLYVRLVSGFLFESFLFCLFFLQASFWSVWVT